MLSNFWAPWIVRLLMYLLKVNTKVASWEYNPLSQNVPPDLLKSWRRKIVQNTLSNEIIFAWSWPLSFQLAFSW